MCYSCSMKKKKKKDGNHLLCFWFGSVFTARSLPWGCQCNVMVHLCAVSVRQPVCSHLHECVYTSKSIHLGQAGVLLPFCTSFPSLIRTHSVNQAWIPNTITCKVLCLGVIGLARAVFVKRLAPLLSLSLSLFLSLWPEPEAVSKKCSWLQDNWEMK